MSSPNGKLQESEWFRVGALLAVAGGLLDAYTYLCRGGVFANAQTGNIVLIGIRAVAGDWTGMVAAILPVIAFAAGVLVTELIRRKFKTADIRSLHWRHFMLMIEIGLLTIIAFVPLGRMDYFVNIVVSFICSLQVQTFRKVHGYAFASTMCTGNLRSGTEALISYILDGKTSERHHCLCCYGIILFFILGALIGSFVSMSRPVFTLPIAIACYVTVFLLMIEWKI